MYKVNSYAKVNLSLDVLSKRDDGYHNIDTIMQLIDLKDIISIEVVTGQNNPKVLEAFGMKPEGKNDFAAITYTNALKNDVVSLSVSYIPLALFPEICEDIESGKDVLRGKYPLIPSSTKSMLDVINTDQKEAVYLQLQPGQPLIQINNTLYSKSGQPVEYIITKYRADKTRLQFEDHK